MRIRTRPLPGHKIIASMSWGCLALVSHFFSFSVGKGMFYEFCAFEQDPMCVSMCCICVCVAWCMCTSTCRGFILSCKNKKSTLSVLLCVCSSWTSCMYACVGELHADSNSCSSCLPAYSNAPMAKSKKKNFIQCILPRYYVQIWQKNWWIFKKISKKALGNWTILRSFSKKKTFKN